MKVLFRHNTGKPAINTYFPQRRDVQNLLIYIIHPPLVITRRMDEETTLVWRFLLKVLPVHGRTDPQIHLAAEGLFTIQTIQGSIGEMNRSLSADGEVGFPDGGQSSGIS